VELFIGPILKALFLIPITLLPIINPLGAAPVFIAAVGNDRDRAKRLARQIAINSWFVLVASMLIGTYVLELFGISLPVVRVGGGLLVATTGWRMLHTSADNDIQAAAAEEASTLSHAQLIQHSFFPMTFPLTTGPGAITVSIALGTQISTANPVSYLAGAIVAAMGSMLVSIVLYFVFRNSTHLLDWLGEIGTLVMMRLMAFILLCIGIQIMWTGWAELNGMTL
jgi:multiple antibiotic resistance protein